MSAAFRDYPVAVAHIAQVFPQFLHAIRYAVCRLMVLGGRLNEKADDCGKVVKVVAGFGVKVKIFLRLV